MKHNIRLRPEPVKLVPMPELAPPDGFLSKRKDFFPGLKTPEGASGNKRGVKRVKSGESLVQPKLGNSVHSTRDFLSQLTVFAESTDSILVELANVNLHLGTKTNSSRFKWLKTLNHFVKIRYFYSELEQCLYNPSMFFTFFRSLIGNFGRSGKLTFYEFKHIKRQYLTPRLFDPQFVVSILKNRLKQHHDSLLHTFSELQVI